MAAVILVLGGVIGFMMYDKYRVPPEILEDNITFITSEGVQGLGDFKGQSTVVIFYARWCGQCMAEMEPLRASQATLNAEDIRIVALTDDNPELIQKVRDHFGITFDQFQLEKTLKEHEIFTIPTAYVLNAHGEIVFEHVGVLDWSDESFLKEIIALTKA